MSRVSSLVSPKVITAMYGSHLHLGRCFLKERQERWGRVRSADGRQRWVRAGDLRPAKASNGIPAVFIGLGQNRVDGRRYRPANRT